MSIDARFKRIITFYKQPLEAILDPLCLVNEQGQIMYANPAMKSFLRVGTRDLAKRPIFCDLLTLDSCSKVCQVLKTIKIGEPIRLDETPALLGDTKVRILFKVVPLFDPGLSVAISAMGAIITLRDTTADVVVQAAYHKLLAVVEAKDIEIQELKEKLQKLRDTFRYRSGGR